MSTPDDESELNAEQIAQEFNRRAWKGKTGNVGGWFVGHNSIQAIRGTGGEGFFTYDFDDARALLAGWQAMEELAALNAQLDAEIKYADSLSTQLTALTAENERLSGKLTDAADTIRILHREKREGADVSEAEAIRLSTKIERLREPAEGVEALAQRIAERLGGDESAIRIKALGGCHCRYNYVNAAALIATELRKGVEPAEGTWGWAIGQVGKTVQRGQGPETVKVFISEHCGLFLDGCKGALTRADYESTDWQIADEGSES